MLFFILQACGIENLIHSNDHEDTAVSFEDSEIVKNATVCVFQDHSKLVPASANDDNNLTPWDLENAARLLTNNQGQMRENLNNILILNGYTTDQLTDGTVPVHIVVLVNQNDNFDESGDYEYLLVFGSDKETLESYSESSSLAKMAQDLSLNAIQASATVDFTSSTSSQNFGCAVYMNGENTDSNINYLLQVDSTDHGIVYTTEHLPIPLFPNQTDEFYTSFYTRVYNIGTVTTDVLGSDLYSSNQHSGLLVFELYPNE